jgi:hypothetical protein
MKYHKNCPLYNISIYKLNDLGGKTQGFYFVKDFKNDLQFLNMH